MRAGSLIRDPGREDFIHQLPYALHSRNGPTNKINLCLLGDIRVHQQTPLYLQKDEIKLSVLEGCINIYLVILLCAFEMEAAAVPGNLMSQQNADGDSLSCPSFAQRPFF